MFGPAIWRYVRRYGAQKPIRSACRVWERGEERRIGFHQNAVVRNVFCRLLNQGCVFKGNDSRERNIKPKIHCCTGKTDVFGKTVDNARINPAFFQDRQGIRRRITRMDDNGQSGLIGCFDVVCKAFVLPGQIAFAPVIIQTRLANADHFRRGGFVDHFRDGKFFGFLTVGMYAYGAIDVFVRFGDGKDFGEAFLLTLMASACPTPFASMLDKTSGRRSFKPSKLRWQCESMICMALHGKRRSAAADCAAQFDFDLVFDFQAVFVFCECQPNPFGFGGSTRRINPSDLGWQEQFGEVEDFYGKQNIVPDGKYVVGLHKQAAMFQKRHIGAVQQIHVFQLQRHHFCRNILSV